MKVSILMTLILICLSSNVFSQAEDPLGCATEASKSLGFLEGTWKVKSNFRVNRNDDVWEKTEGISMIRPVFKDCVYREILTGKRNGRFHQFTGMYSYNNLSNKLQWAGGHSEHGMLALYEGGFEDGVLILNNETEIRGRKIFFRTVISKTDSGFRIRSERSVDGVEWDTGWYLEYNPLPPGQISAMTLINNYASNFDLNPVAKIS